jgi:hypothetical protein
MRLCQTNANQVEFVTPPSDGPRRIPVISNNRWAIEKQPDF